MGGIRASALLPTGWKTLGNQAALGKKSEVSGISLKGAFRNQSTFILVLALRFSVFSTNGVNFNFSKVKHHILKILNLNCVKLVRQCFHRVKGTWEILCIIWGTSVSK